MKRELLLLFMHMLLMQVACYEPHKRHKNKNYDDTPSYPIEPPKKKVPTYSIMTVRPINDTNADEYDRGYTRGYSAGQDAAEHTYMVDVYTTVDDPFCTTTQIVEDPVTSTTTIIPIATSTIDIPYTYYTTTLPEKLLTITIPVRTKIVTIPVFTTTITRRYISA